MIEKACIKCKRITGTKTCSECKTSKLTTKWNGLLIVLDEESNIGKLSGLKPGKYALKVRS